MIECNIWAWDRLPEHIFRWAWVSRGLVDVAEMALANGMTKAEMIASLETAEHDTDAFSLREVPTLDPPPLWELHDSLAPGEVKYCWQFASDAETYGDAQRTWN